METEKNGTLDKERVKGIVESLGEISSHDLIPLLQAIQNEYGYLPEKILKEVCKLTKISPARVIGVATFYEQFHLQPHGRHSIKCCRGTACHVQKGPEIVDAIQEELDVKPGQTTEDSRFTFELVACLGTCFLAPVIMINNDYYGNLTAKKVKKVLKRYT
jgi:NADH-quinone oxidoreductase subunit E